MPSAPRFPFFPPDAMLLAAGLGLRLQPLTVATPKPLLKVAGTALIDRVIAAAAAEGVSHFVVNAHRHAGQIRAHLDGLATARPDCRFRLSEEAVLLETGGGLKQALPLLETDPVLAMNTDSFWPAGADAPLARLAARFAQGDADIVLLCVTPARAQGFDGSPDFDRAADGRLGRDAGEPVIYAGTALIARALVEAESDDKFSLYRLFVAALKRGRLFGELLEADWLHVGDPAALALAEQRLAGGPR